MLLIDVLRSYAQAKKFHVHDFVVMPDHLRLLLTVGSDMSIERAMQYIKGGVLLSLKEGDGIRRWGVAARVFGGADRRRSQF